MFRTFINVEPVEHQSDGAIDIAPQDEQNKARITGDYALNSLSGDTEVSTPKVGDVAKASDQSYEAKTHLTNPQAKPRHSDEVSPAPSSVNRYISNHACENVYGDTSIVANDKANATIFIGPSTTVNQTFNWYVAPSADGEVRQEPGPRFAWRCILGGADECEQCFKSHESLIGHLFLAHRIRDYDRMCQLVDLEIQLPGNEIVAARELNTLHEPGPRASRASGPHTNPNESNSTSQSTRPYTSYTSSSLNSERCQTDSVSSQCLEDKDTSACNGGTGATSLTSSEGLRSIPKDGVTAFNTDIPLEQQYLSSNARKVPNQPCHRCGRQDQQIEDRSQQLPSGISPGDSSLRSLLTSVLEALDDLPVSKEFGQLFRTVYIDYGPSVTALETWYQYKRFILNEYNPRLQTETIIGYQLRTAQRMILDDGSQHPSLLQVYKTNPSDKHLEPKRPSTNDGFSSVQANSNAVIKNQTLPDVTRHGPYAEMLLRSHQPLDATNAPSIAANDKPSFPGGYSPPAAMNGAVTCSQDMTDHTSTPLHSNTVDYMMYENSTSEIETGVRIYATIVDLLLKIHDKSGVVPPPSSQFSPSTHEAQDVEPSPSSSSKPSQGSSLQHSTRRPAQGGRKRARALDGHRDDDQSDQSRPPDKRAKTDREMPDLFWACPYTKAYPEQYSVTTPGNCHKCNGLWLYTINDVKQHLDRAHKPLENYCAMCYEAFPSSTDRDNHARGGHCGGIQNPPIGKMTKEMYRQIRDIRKERNGSSKDHWYTIFEILFPGHERPRTPYQENPDVHNCLSHMLALFRAVGSQADILYNILRNDPAIALPANSLEVVEQAWSVLMNGSTPAQPYPTPVTTSTRTSLTASADNFTPDEPVQPIDSVDHGDSHADHQTANVPEEFLNSTPPSYCPWPVGLTPMDDMQGEIAHTLFEGGLEFFDVAVEPDSTELPASNDYD